MAIEKMVRLDHDGDAGAALIETARAAGPRLQLIQAAGRECFLQRVLDRFRAFRGAATARIIVRAPVRADEQVVLP